MNIMSFGMYTITLGYSGNITTKTVMCTLYQIAPLIRPVLIHQYFRFLGFFEYYPRSLFQQYL